MTPKMPFFLPYQQHWIQDDSRLKLMEKSRQIGMSWTAAYGLVREQALQSTRLDAWVSSRDESQARLFLDDCHAFADILQLAACDLGTCALEGKQRSSAFVLEFANGKRIHSLSSNPDAQAGKRGTRVLDEFALHPEPEQLYNIAYPGITWGGRLEIISTHRGAQHLFNKLVEEARHGGNPKGISLHRVTLEDALDQGFLEKLKHKLPKDDPRQQMDDGSYFDFIRASCVDEEAFQQEYMCHPSDDRSAFISDHLITLCSTDEPDWEWTHLPEKGAATSEFFAGVDIARKGDLSVFWLMESLGDVLHTRMVRVFRDTPFSTQEQLLYDWLDNPRVRRVCIDQSGLGRQFAERAEQRFGAGRVEGLTFTAALKEQLAYPLRTAFENRSLRIPSEKTIRADLRAVRRDTTRTGSVRIGAERTRDGHADRFWALALALHAASHAQSRPHYESLTPLTRHSR